MRENELFPIKVVLPHPDFHVTNEPGGTAGKIFEDVTPQSRTALIQQATAIQEAYEEHFSARPRVPAVAKVQLKHEALAKSHRPDRLFSAETCPIIGVGTFRELFVRVTPSGLSNLAVRLRSDTTHEGRANISTVSELKPLNMEDKLGVTNQDQLQAIFSRVDADGVIKVQLFDHGDVAIDRNVLEDFRALLNSIGSELRDSKSYTPHLIVHEVGATSEQLQQIARHPGIRRAGFIPRFFAVKHSSIPVANAATRELPVPRPSEEYPMVAIVDSGVAPTCTPVQPWVQQHESYVAPDEENRDHGTFVAGLVTFGPEVNSPGVADTGGPCRILDVSVIPNHDVARGATGELRETDLVAILQEVVPRYRGQVRVWNLSLGSESLCTDTAFSDLGQALDALQRAHAVQFVLAAGNIDDLPLRSWPPDGAIGERDRICSPADSVVSLTVGALAHARNLRSVVDVDEPSPFSRRGPGPAYLVKPEIVHYGGNCDSAGNYQTTGIRSLDVLARVAEDAGTSFSTPLISALLANVIGGLEPEPSLNLAKALVIHAANYPLGIGHDDIDYVGFGRPINFESVVHSVRSAATLIFEDELQPGSHLELDPFPFPQCLIRRQKHWENQDDTGVRPATRPELRS